MNCNYHQDREVVAACTECGSFICEGCRVVINGKAVCKNCIETGAFKPKRGYQYNSYNNSTKQQRYQFEKISNKSWIVTLLLALFTGPLGIHRFYVGKIGTGILQLFTGGGFGIWALVDFVLIACKKFTDSKGYLIAE